MIGTVRTVLALTVVALTTLVLAPLQMFCLKTRLCRGRRLLRFWHKVATRMLGIRIRVFGGAAPGRPLMIAANHVSWLDITVLAAVAEVSFIAKSEMSGWPIFGWFSRMQRSVYVERDRRRKSGDQASEIAVRLADGDVMVLFAEGTTGDGNQILPFKTTLFGAASMMLSASRHDEMWIQPVALAYTRLQGLPMGRQYRGLAAWIGDEDLVPHLGAVLREGAMDVEVHFGEPVLFTAKSNRKEVARLTEERVRKMLSAALANPAPHL
ncbi:lysophospholipid acyltransferase family protein [Mesorhizobium sp. IMUNJ 23232]|uniref:lysophospholipid acyltransferase family protein n=1 Tax=Mesorhizobium sp. IMUNJ 23232 TaxID=3376064 RepID=UPI0037AB38F4